VVMRTALPILPGRSVPSSNESKVPVNSFPKWRDIRALWLKSARFSLF